MTNCLPSSPDKRSPDHSPSKSNQKGTPEHLLTHPVMSGVRHKVAQTTALTDNQEKRVAFLKRFYGSDMNIPFGEPCLIPSIDPNSNTIQAIIVDSHVDNSTVTIGDVIRSMNPEAPTPAEESPNTNVISMENIAVPGDFVEISPNPARPGIDGLAHIVEIKANGLVNVEFHHTANSPVERFLIPLNQVTLRFPGNENQ